MSASAENTNSCTTKTGASKKTLWIVGVLAAILAAFGIFYSQKPEKVHKVTDKCREGFRKVGPQQGTVPANKKIFVIGSIVTTLASLALLHYWCRPDFWRNLFSKKQPVAEPTK